MLARGVLARLAADSNKTSSTHDLARASHQIQRRLLSRNGLFATSSATRSRSYEAVLLEYRRSYATTARATKPTATVKKAVKKTVAAKKPVKRTAAKKTTATKKPVKKVAKKPAAKKKAAPKKRVAAKPKRRVKELTDEDRLKLRIKARKAEALEPPHAPKALSAWNVVLAEVMSGDRNGQSPEQHSKVGIPQAAAKYKNMTPAEKEHYNHLANERTVAIRKTFEAWIKQHTPEQIRQANLARAYLRRVVEKPSMRRRYFRLEDDRALKQPLSGYLRFSMERRNSGDMKSISLTEVSKLAAQEWKALSAGEKKKYNDAYAAEKTQYVRKYQQTYGHAPGVVAA